MGNAANFLMAAAGELPVPAAPSAKWSRIEIPAKK
jgi:hypothetical protein